MALIDPYFETYGADLGARMTDFLYNDPSIEVMGTPQQWHGGPRVQFVNRNFNFPNIGAGRPGIQNVDFGGRNCLVFSRVTSVLPFPLVPVGIPQLPNENVTRVQVQINKLWGQTVVEQSNSNTFFGQLAPVSYVYPQPLFWYGRDARQTTCSVLVGDGAACTVDLSFCIAILDDGR